MTTFCESSKFAFPNSQAISRAEPEFSPEVRTSGSPERLADRTFLNTRALAGKTIAKALAPAR
jgi:hypothetical protein